ncbi:hypothetical protein [Bifidobacterium bifidum]|nr:hypothetical protein [Bifidobacterium bifidum]
MSEALAVFGEVALDAGGGAVVGVVAGRVGVVSLGLGGQAQGGQVEVAV